jgi:hypothetical protein
MPLWAHPHRKTPIKTSIKALFRIVRLWFYERIYTYTERPLLAQPIDIYYF